MNRISVLLTLLAATPLTAAEPPVPDEVQFNRDVRPILSDNCFFCHGPDASERAADLRLDLREAAVAYEAVVPGEPDKSSLIARIFAENPDERMPPPDSHKKLTARQKEILRRWIAQGAEYQLHWSFERPVKPEIPAGRHPVDVLVGRRLKEIGLTPSAEADRRTLIQRLYNDLIGLPPTPAEVKSFVMDAAPDAYERLIDRLLQDPRYGERMALG